MASAGDGSRPSKNSLRLQEGEEEEAAGGDSIRDCSDVGVEEEEAVGEGR